ncbi:hypothetical protein psyc5s11_22630 [Clostridium gelidum]|uniref:GxGYxYP putative glycoside hydrolase first N-terminal domain-containing protein n=1 Tax=Clostridium gelidum TaxID=704125 RepID=A0ABM7T3I2_9CLOT|nr:hypothetical protein psyc5s11_22630 [Clostridium gelidum]
MQPDYPIWLDDLKNNSGILYKNISDPCELLDTFKNYVDGYILYNKSHGNKSQKDPSTNNCS